MRFHFVLMLTLVIALLNPVSAQKKPLTVRGKIVDSTTKKPVEFATVILKNKDTNEMIDGVTSASDGAFSIKATSQSCYLEISFIGFEDKVIESLVFKNDVCDLGSIMIAENKKILGEVTVRAEKSQTEFKLDKRVFNVGKDLSTTGASALEVLNNVPSVNVSIEGDISLRGSTGVQILINGKPSILTGDQGNALGTITAEMIDKIEVITNPSAKYDAEGTSGIINIVIKKEERKGTNGSISINTGTPHNHSIGLSLNRRSEKFNLFTQLGGGYKELPSDNRVVNSDFVSSQTLRSTGEEFRNENFYNFVLGTDYHMNRYNVLTVSGNFAYEIEDQPSSTLFEQLNEEDIVINRWQRTEVTEATNPKYQYEVQYKKDFEGNKEQALLFSALGSFFGKEQSSMFNDNTISGERSSTEQRTSTDFNEANHTIKLDYTKPAKHKITFETGAQYVINDVNNDFAVDNLENGVFVNDPGLTNNFNFDQKVLGTYGTVAKEGLHLGVKIGLRVENTDLKTLLVNTNDANNRNYTNLFPSGHLSYKFNDHHSIQAGYSRRIYRPRLWDLNPFFNIRNNFNIRVGNPDLLPEFTDSYELVTTYGLQKTDISLGVYHRYTTDVIERVSFFENNVNTRKPVNIGTNNATGIEANMKYTATKFLTINTDFNYNYFSRLGSLESNSFDFNADQWSGKLNLKIKLPADIDIETTGQYLSGYETVQGKVSAMAFLDFGCRKKMAKGKGVLNLSVRDVFASRIWETTVAQTDFSIYRRYLRGRFITLGFSYGFGKGEAMEFSGVRRRR